MDHHCAFVNNCVGANNYKFFFLLLVYTTVGGLYNAAVGLLWLRTAAASVAANSDNQVPQMLRRTLSSSSERAQAGAERARCSADR